DENEIVNRYTKNIVPSVKSVVSKTEVLELQKLTRDVPIAEDIKIRAIKIVGATRGKSEHIEYGASPRASIGIILAAKARALMKGRNYVSKEDIDVMAYPVLRHRVILTFESERKGMTTDQVISDILKNVK
ncbi:MAG: MoxR family ATPase, partial [Candidatus Methanoperedens sp.]|nr:MoxR family ATPase [Candidatus Methanoperedens sp.]